MILSKKRYDREDTSGGSVRAPAVPPRGRGRSPFLRTFVGVLTAGFTLSHHACWCVLN
jgi:hypothetical protein